MKAAAQKLILIVPVLFISFSIVAQVPVYRNYSTVDGLPSANIYSVMQDDKGFIWFSTDNGVSRFDGTRFKNFSIADGLSDNSVLQIVEDSYGRIWFLTFSGKLSFYQDEKIYNSANCELIRKANLNSSIQLFEQDSKKNIWINSYDQDMIKISPSNVVTKFHSVLSKCLWEDKAGNIKAIGASGTFNLKDSTFTFTPFNAKTKHAVFLPGDSLLLLSGFVGLQTYNINSGSIATIKNMEKYTAFNILGIYIDNKKNCWLSTLNGAIKFDSSMLSAKHQHVYFPNYSINATFQDKDGNYWFSSFGNGVFMIPSLDIKLYDKQSGLVENDISSICKINDNQWMVGTHNGSIQLIDHNTVKENNKTLFKASGSIYKISNDEKGNIWILTDVFLVKYYKGNFTVLKDKRHWYKTLLITHEGTCLIGKGRGISEVKNDSVVDRYIISGTNRVYAIAEIDKNNFWLGTDKGLYQFKDNELYPVKSDNLIIKHRINALTFSSDSTLWIATDGYGLLSYNNHKITRYSTTEKLLDNRCNTMLADSNKIYIGTDKGLNIVELINGVAHIFSYSAANGLINNHIHDIVKKDKYTFLLATDQGVIEFDIRKLSPPFTGSPYINEVTVNDNKTSFSKPLNLHYNENAISVDFGTINFNSDGNINYRYRLVGADSGWNYSSTHSVKFSYLRPGNYKFIVTTQNTDGSWNSKQASFSFFIQTPWWNTWWFRTIAALSIIIVITLVVRNRITVYKQKLNQQRALLESELKALRAQINPHFIFNSLNSIQDFIMMNQKEDAHLYLAKFATLMRNILAHSRSAKITLDEEIKSLQLYLELEAIGFNNQFTFHFIVDKQINPEEVQIPSMILQPYIENAILHGLAPVKNNGMITISFQIKDNLLVCMIEDNGVGRKKAAEKREQGIWKSQPSLGMLVTQERIDLISAYQNEKINLQITDLVNDENIGCGTRVTICFPLDN